MKGHWVKHDMCKKMEFKKTFTSKNAAGSSGIKVIGKA